jgi:arabinose-5-phosphate isomerase
MRGRLGVARERVRGLSVPVEIKEDTPRLPDEARLLPLAKDCLRWEVQAIEATAADIGEEFLAVSRLLHATVCAGRKLIFSGVGKNVAVAQKLVATFNSTGVRSTFLDPLQAFHGDLGLCMAGDLAFLLSNSGETDEIVQLLPALRRFGVGVVAFTAEPNSQLARNADAILRFRYQHEGCPLNLAPTASTTAAQALGDALAMAYMGARGFSREDFARFHPGGALGQRLLLKVSDIMRTGARFAVVEETASVQAVLLALTEAKCGTAAVCDVPGGCLTGVFTDGDFRRLALAFPDVLKLPVAEHMTRQPRSIKATALAVEALKILENSRVNDLVVLDADDRPVGLLDGQDLPKLRLY